MARKTAYATAVGKASIISPTIEVSGLDVLAESIGQTDARMKKVMAGQFHRAKPDGVSYAKTNAPWTDRTGNARAGLHAIVDARPSQNTFTFVMAHTVFYGVFLENRWSGKYAILLPTIKYVGDLLMQRMASSLARMEAGE